MVERREVSKTKTKNESAFVRIVNPLSGGWPKKNQGRPVSRESQSEPTAVHSWRRRLLTSSSLYLKPVNKPKPFNNGHAVSL